MCHLQPHGPPGDEQASPFGSSPGESGEKFRHHSEKLSPEIDRFPAGQDVAPCLYTLPETNVSSPLFTNQMQLETIFLAIHTERDNLERGMPCLFFFFLN